jgi:hypothetical protein
MTSFSMKKLQVFVYKYIQSLDQREDFFSFLAYQVHNLATLRYASLHLPYFFFLSIIFSTYTSNNLSIGVLHVPIENWFYSNHSLVREN